MQRPDGLKQISYQEYSNLPVALYLRNDVRELDRFAIEECGINGFDLMSSAARFSFHCLMKTWPSCRSLVVLCGSGNNAGDGYIVASLAKKRDVAVTVLHLADPDKLKGDARLAYLQCKTTQVTCLPFSLEAFEQLTHDEEIVIVDALLGTGLNSEITGDYAHAIAAINQQPHPVLAVDIPSGLCSDTGQALGIAVKATLTTTFIGLKLGLFTGSGRDYCGEICFSSLKLPEEIFKHRQAPVSRLDIAGLLSGLSPRARTSHKGNCGRLTVIGGDTGFGGAVVMASMAAARIGAGLTSVITQETNRSALHAAIPEVMVHCPASTVQIQPLLDNSDVIVIGPGLAQSAWSEKMLQAALNANKPLVLDADALNLLAFHSHLKRLYQLQKPEVLEQHVLTPHPGEAARLLNLSTQAIQADRRQAILSLQANWQGHILLKGSGSLLINPNQEIMLCPYGNPGMASGGMGDVLSGLIGGLLAQGIETAMALQLAVCLHARAADIASDMEGERGLLATDLIPLARRLLNRKQA